jgi:hypothetical protein
MDQTQAGMRRKQIEIRKKYSHRYGRNPGKEKEETSA